MRNLPVSAFCRSNSLSTRGRSIRGLEEWRLPKPIWNQPRCSPNLRRAPDRRRACRYLANLEAVAESQFEAPITVFVSHAKADIEREPKVTKRLIESLRQDQPIEAWVDSGDITAGSKFGEAIEHGVKGLRYSLSLRTLTPHANGAAKKFCSPRSTSALW